MKLLLDQNFPKPPGFDVHDVDNTVQVEHLADFDVALTRSKTPDWFIYAKAALAGFDGLVTRDKSQLEQTEEVWVLTKLPLLVVTFWKSIEDPISEWGQLLAYLPLLQKESVGSSSVIVRLPRPTISQKNRIPATELLGTMAREQGISNQQFRRDAERQVRAYLSDHDPGGLVLSVLGA